MAALLATAVACGDDGKGGGGSGGQAAGGGGAGGAPQGGDNQGGDNQGGDNQGGAGGQSACTEITVATLTTVQANGDYNYGNATSQFGDMATDNLVLELYNGLDTPTVDIANDSKTRKPTTCEACGWVFQDGNGTTAPKIFFHESGQIALEVPNFGNQLSVQPTSGTLTDVTYREVTLTDPNDIYTAELVPGGACVHIASASF
ncbi:MAG: hypothetical protein U0271_43505 [Polyangiaceae bacterium]